MGFYTANLIITLAFLSVTVIDVCTNRVIDNKMKKGSILVCLFIGISIFCEWLGVKTNGADVSLISIHRIVKLIEFCMAPVISVASAFSYSQVKRPKLILSVLIIHILFQLVSLKEGWVFYVDAENIYHRQWLYWIYIATFSVSILYCFKNIVREEMKFYRKPAAVLIATLMFLTMGISIQMFKPDLRVDYMCVAIGNFLLYNHRCKMIFQLDGLTHLFNRRCYEKDIKKINFPTVILNMDINKFKVINDTYGHSTGDYYLKTIAKIIRKTYGKYGSCYRLGGDEFCVILDRNIDDVQKMNDRFRQSINEMRKADNRAPDVSIGYAYYNEKNEHVKKIIEEADEMMYSNKHQPETYRS